jgi:hypothetical protein
MKILFDFQDMSGGAPRSQLAHMQLMKKAGHEVVATIGEDHDLLKKKAEGVRVIKVENFHIEKPITNIKNIRKWLQLLRKEKPGIIHANRTNQYKMLAVVSDLSGIPLLFSQAGGKAKYANILPMKGRKAIVYSVENKQQLLKVGFKESDISD